MSAATVEDLKREIVILNICRRVEKRHIKELESRVDRADNLIKEIADELSKHAQYAYIHSMADKYLFIREGEDAGD